MKQIRVAILGTFFLIFLSIVTAVTLKAQQANNGLVVHPSNFDLTYTGSPTTQTVTLDNLTNQTVTIRADLRNFTATGEEGSVALTNEDTTYSLAKWITVTPTTATLPAHSSKDFSFTITPPKNAEAGGHFGSIVFATVPPKNTNGNVGTALSEEIASLILFKIPGATEERAIVESFTTDKQFYEFGPVFFTLRVKNLGQVHVAPMGQIVVKGTFGDSYIVPVDPRNILPNSIRKIPSTLSQKLLFGRYTATLIAAYGSKNEQLSTSTQFLAFPIRYGLGILAVVVLLFLMRKRMQKALKALLTGK